MDFCYPISKPVRSAVPTFEPITLAEAKRQLSLEHTDHLDADVLDLITFAREQVERDAMMVIATGTFTVKRTDWGSGDYFELPSNLRPCTAVTAITYIDTAGATQTWSSAQYSLDTYTIQPIVKLGYDYVWPTVRGDINGITITATAGYAETAVPKRVDHAVKMKLAELWQTRMEMTKDADGSSRAYDSIIANLRHEVYA